MRGDQSPRYPAEGRGRRYFVAEVAPAAWQPNVDVYQTDEAIVVIVELSGIHPNSMDISIDGRVLKLSGARAPRFRHGPRQFFQLEIPQGAYERAVRLPAQVDESRAEASYSDGFLEIVLPLVQPVRPAISVRSTAGAE
jgi:HSP20 family protein